MNLSAHECDTSLNRRCYTTRTNEWGRMRRAGEANMGERTSASSSSLESLNALGGAEDHVVKDTLLLNGPLIEQASLIIVSIIGG